MSEGRAKRWKTIAGLAVSCLVAGAIAAPETYFDLAALMLGDARTGEIVATSTSKGSRSTIRYFVEVTYSDGGRGAQKARAETSENEYVRVEARLREGRNQSDSAPPSLPQASGRVWAAIPDHFALDDDGGVRRFNSLLMLAIFVGLATLILVLERSRFAK